MMPPWVYLLDWQGRPSRITDFKYLPGFLGLGLILWGCKQVTQSFAKT
jgi:hypothetical protein